MSELEKDPKAVLETHGLFLNSQEIPSAISLPSVEAIQEAYLAVDESLNFHGFFGGGGD